MKTIIISIILSTFVLYNSNAQQSTLIKANILPVILNGYGGSIEQKIYKQYSAEIGMTTFDRIFLTLDPSIPKIDDPFKEQHIYLNIFRNIMFAKNHYLQFGTQINLYSRSDFSNEFVTAFRTLNGTDPNSEKIPVGSILLGYKAEFARQYNLGFQLAYNLKDKTEVRSAFSVSVGYGFNSNGRKENFDLL